LLPVEGDHWVTVSSNGGLDVVAGHDPIASWQLPTPGSPRSLAAHPAHNWIAIGMEQSGWANPRGTVDVIEIGMDLQSAKAVPWST